MLRGSYEELVPVEFGLISERHDDVYFLRKSSHNETFTKAAVTETTE